MLSGAKWVLQTEFRVVSNWHDLNFLWHAHSPHFNRSIFSFLIWFRFRFFPLQWVCGQVKKPNFPLYYSIPSSGSGLFPQPLVTEVATVFHIVVKICSLDFDIWDIVKSPLFGLPMSRGLILNKIFLSYAKTEVFECASALFSSLSQRNSVMLGCDAPALSGIMT